MNDILGLDLKELEWHHMVMRTVVVFFSAMIFLRLAGRRAFGVRTPFDVVLSITIGGILSRAIGGHYPFFPCLASALALAILHRIVAHLACRFEVVRQLMEGNPVILFSNGKKYENKMHKHGVDDEDLQRSLRKQKVADFDKVQTIMFETDGSLSVIEKEGGS
jgi:uncharacterized membrane protein YcaP (DUF421 family)